MNRGPRAFIEFAEWLAYGGARRGGKTQAMRVGMGMREEIPATFTIVQNHSVPKGDVLLTEYVRTVAVLTTRGVRRIDEYRVTATIYNLKEIGP